MKSLKDIENMSLEHLEDVSLDETIAVPEGLVRRVQERVDALETIDRIAHGIPSRHGKIRMMVGAAASIVVLAGLGLGLAGRQNEPKDTFDDPYLAYAELEKAFATMSDGLRKGMSMAKESETIIDKTTSFFSE